MEEELLYLHVQFEQPMSVNKNVMPTSALLLVHPSYIFEFQQNKNNHYVLVLQEILTHQAHQKAQKI
jgi:hypothetical protein